MAVDLRQELLDLLACPCPRHAPLRTGLPGDPAADYLTCTACSRSFPVSDGIPVLLLEEARTSSPDQQPAGDDGGSAEDAGRPGVREEG